MGCSRWRVPLRIKWNFKSSFIPLVRCLSHRPFSPDETGFLVSWIFHFAFSTEKNVARSYKADSNDANVSKRSWTADVSTWSIQSTPGRNVAINTSQTGAGYCRNDEVEDTERTARDKHACSYIHTWPDLATCTHLWCNLVASLTRIRSGERKVQSNAKSPFSPDNNPGNCTAFVRSVKKFQVETMASHRMSKRYTFKGTTVKSLFPLERQMTVIFGGHWFR